MILLLIVGRLLFGISIHFAHPSLFALRRLMLAALCALAALLVANPAQAHSLHAAVDGNRIRAGVEFRGGSRKLAHPRLARHQARPVVHAIQTITIDDSTLNDSSRLLIVWAGPERTRLVLVGHTVLHADAPVPDLTCRRRSPRGPPPLLAS